jgi:ATP-dependent DNA helicase RecQ
VLKTAKGTGERFGLNHLVHVIRGSENQYVMSYHHNELDEYGKGADQDDEYWKSIVRQALIYDYLEKDVENIGLLKLSEKGKKFLKKPESVQFSKDHDYDSELPEEEEARTNNVGKAYDQELFGQLKALRKDMAHRKGLPPFVIFQDPSLEEMATTYPTTENDLAQVNGVGMGKVKKFGGEFIKLIEAYIDEHDIIPASDVVVKSSVNKSKMKIFIIQQIDKKVELEEIAESLNIPFEQLLNEIENICYSGTKLNLDYYIDEILDYDKQDDIFEYFMNAETDSLEEALDDEDNDEYSEEELRLMRIKFMSEYAN